MKIISWNCNGAFRKKYSDLIKLDADIYVIQECENPVESKDENYRAWACNYLWIGDKPSKGLGIFASESINLEVLNWSDKFTNHSVKHFLPCIINDSIQLVAVWTHNNNSPTFGYIGQLWKYLQVNKENLSRGQSIVVGDFNSNAIWDKWDRWWNHSDVVQELKQIGIESLYHLFFNEIQGKETQSTYFHYRKYDKPYHIDYCFASQSFVNRLKECTVCEFKDWSHLSDHVPLSITVYS